MSENIPIKSENNGEIKQFVSGDFISVKHGGTGCERFIPKPVIAPAGQIVGNETNALQLLKCVYNADRDPTTGDDSADGFSIGSRWINIEDNNEWVCLSNKKNEALWVITSSGESPLGDIFRYYGSLVDFKYDYQDYTWEDVNDNRKNEVIQIDYYEGGFTGTYVASMLLEYTTENQPTKITMTYISPSRPTKIINLTYDSNGYFNTMTRI